MYDCVRVRVQVLRKSLDTKQTHTEEMGLCVAGDPCDATMYTVGQGNSVWHTYSPSRRPTSERR